MTLKRSKNTVNKGQSPRRQIVIDDETGRRAERLKKVHKRSFSGLCRVLVNAEYDRLFKPREAK